MIFTDNRKIYYNSFNFLIEDYGYTITSSTIKDGLWYSCFTLTKENFPSLKIEIEKGYIIIFIQIDEIHQWSLAELYKFLHHDKIVKCIYSNAKQIKDSFEKTMKIYLDEILEKINFIENEQIEKF